MNKITQQVVAATRASCYDYMYKNNEGNLRERYAFLITEGKAGITLVECNTNGCFLMKDDAGLREAFKFIANT